MAEIIPLIVIFAVLGIVLFVMLTRRGKGMLFGGRIIKTYDGVSAKRRMIASKIKVHVIDGGGENKVGLELVTTSLGSYQMMPATLPAAEARKLAAMLLEAADYHAKH
ncbi:hypothetical protein [Spongiibacter tropicus]|uniref:hypothetical protein n=1 Tax=Spongiibacter tropicus TaxID=454602 RepID=UPI0035BE45B8